MTAKKQRPVCLHNVQAGLLSLIICLAFLLLTSPAYAVTIDGDFVVSDLNKEAQTSFQPVNVTYDGLLSLVDQFQPMPAFTALPEDKRLWYKLSLTNRDRQPSELVLALSRADVDEVRVVVVDERDRIVFSDRVNAKDPVPRFSLVKPGLDFLFPLQGGQTVRLFVGIRDNTSVPPSLALWELQAYNQDTRFRLLLSGIGFGALGLFFCFFLISYLYQRTPARFWLATFNLLFICVLSLNHGILSLYPQLLSHTNLIRLLFTASILFTMAKLAASLFPRIPLWLGGINYLICVAILVSPFWLPAYQYAGVLMLAFPIVGLLQVASCLMYRDRRNRYLTRAFLTAWLFLIGFYACITEIFISHTLLTAPIWAQLTLLLVMASLSLAIAAEIHERNAALQQLNKREQTITDLNHFYKLFKTSAEGLYTSTLDGTLRSINPAMCGLFGYDSEEDMLAQVKNTRDFYARKEDRDKLVGELLEKKLVMGRELKGIRADGSEFWFSLSCQLQEESDNAFLYGSIFDITERKQSSISLEYMATHDALTGVFNRREFELQLEKAIHQDQVRPVILLYLDLDRFKVVNDTCGHKAGDALIKDVAQLLQNSVAGRGMVARLGGDEFAILFCGHSEETAYLNGVKILNAVQSYRFIWENRIFTLGISIGLVECNQFNVGAEQLLSMADAACYIAKEQGRNQIHRYNTDDESLRRYEQELDWVGNINQALESDSFILYYQHCRPLNKTSDGHYYEVLLRLKHPKGDMAPPSTFLPTAERYNLSAKIDRWVVESTFKWLAAHPGHLETLKQCNINLSGHSLADKDLKLFILNAFEKFSIPYHKVCFEITETMAIIKMDETQHFIKTFRQLGCRFALDDFGSGFSSYAYLKHLPVDCVKIDGSFIRDMMNDKVDLAMVASITDVAKALGMQTVGEFVENEATMVELGRMGVDYAQGYGVARPAPLVDFTPL